MTNPWLKPAAPTTQRHGTLAAQPGTQQRADGNTQPPSAVALHPAAREIFSLWASGFTAAAVPGGRRRR